MKILYVANRYDPFKHTDGSGTDYDLYHTFISNGLDVEIVGPFDYPPSFVERVFRRIHRIFSKYRPNKYPDSFLSKSAREVEKAIERSNPAILFSFFAAPLMKADFNVPLVYMLDTTLIGQQDQWPLFSKWAYSSMLRSERAVVNKSAKIITLSQWSAEILNKQYGVLEEDITYLPIPASLPEEKVPEKVEFEKPIGDQVNILLVGRDYRRKGVDIAIEVVRLLNQSNIRTVLRIVGLDGADSDQVHFMGLFDKTVESELESYFEQYQWAHFLIHPARFEAAGIVPGEAAAFGVPTITNASGGLATTVEDGISGVVLPKDSPAEDYARVIGRLMNSPDDYWRLRRTTRDRYEKSLTWSKAGERIVEVLQSVLAQSNGA